MMKEYKGLYFDDRTPEPVMNLLHAAMLDGRRIRVFYGDPETGLDWNETCDTIGRVGKSTGTMPIATTT